MASDIEKAPAELQELVAKVDTGARNIDHILRATLIPQLSSAILSEMAEGHVPETLTLDIDEQSNFSAQFTLAEKAAAE